MEKMDLIDFMSYAIGKRQGYSSGYTEGIRNVELEGNITCADDGQGNVTITEGANNG